MKNKNVIPKLYMTKYEQSLCICVTQTGGLPHSRFCILTQLESYRDPSVFWTKASHFKNDNFLLNYGLPF